jgi:hypothetical protein
MAWYQTFDAGFLAPFSEFERRRVHFVKLGKLSKNAARSARLMDKKIDLLGLLKERGVRRSVSGEKKLRVIPIKMISQR